MVRFIEVFSPFIRFFPVVKPPERTVAFNEKLLWTGLALIVYLIMGEIPLYGVAKGGLGDPFGALRIIFASNRGTLVELGIGPIVSAGLILQILAGSKMINVNFSDPKDRSLFTSASKIFSVIMTIFEASAFIFGGAYGPQPPQNQLIIMLQLVTAGIVIMLLDELLQKGWGIGSGISLFIAAGVARTIWWNSVAPIPVGDGKFMGALPAFIQSISMGEGLQKIFVREGGFPDLLGLLTTIAVFIILIYTSGLHVEIPVSYAKYRGYRGKFPIKLFYTSNVPVIFTAALFGNIYFMSQIIWSNYNHDNSSFWLNLIGQFTAKEQSVYPSGGLVYYVMSPRNILHVLEDPVRAAVYTLLFIAACIFFAVTWVEVGGMDAKTVSKQLLDSGMQIEGFRRSQLPIQQVLSRYIPTVTIISGIMLGVIAVSADLLGAFGTGTGILLTVGILEQYSGLLAKERAAEMFPALRAFLGER